MVGICLQVEWEFFFQKVEWFYTPRETTTDGRRQTAEYNKTTTDS
jgi:hypothetical protein